MTSNFNLLKPNPYSHNGFKSIHVKRMKKSPFPLSLKPSKYRWENVNNLPPIVQSPLHRSPPTIRIEKCTSSHFQPSAIPFSSAVIKGWFVQKSCNTTCIKSPSFDLKSCCFIDSKYLPGNTISANLLSRKITSPSSKKVKELNFEAGNPLVKLSKHKLIRKQDRSSTVKLPIRRTDSSLLVRTRRKLIRRTESIPCSSESSSVRSVPSVTKEESGKKPQLRLPIQTSAEKKDIQSTSSADLVVLTRQKLIRKPQAVVTNSVSDVQSRMISINRNKLINSSLLRSNPKLRRSVLFHMIKERRRPYSRSSYVLLTRNKLIRRAKVKQKLGGKQSSDEAKYRKKSPGDQKTFVSVGSNKLIRKSLFSKRNKLTTSKNAEKTSLPLRRSILSRVLGSPSKRIQRFTNHLTRMSLKYSYVRGRSAYSSKNKRYLNRCKNNRRTFKKKSEKICPIYRKKGLCPKDAKNNCHFVHDPKYIAVCQKFLRGSCENTDCPLSHDLIPQKIPVCVHFLNNMCTIDDCPFLHSKPKLEAPICPQFLLGYCELSDKCPNWHVHACPEYKNTSTCEKGDSCRLPHRNTEYFGNKQADETSSEENWRYFEKNAVDESGHQSVSVIPGRQMLDALPDFIPL